MKVLKFGGTSVGSAKRFKEVARLITAGQNDIVVLSAMGGGAKGVVEIAGYLYNRNVDGAKDTIASLHAKYNGVIKDLLSKKESTEKAQAYIGGIFKTLTEITKEPFNEVFERVILSQGELMSTFLMTTYLEEQGVNVKLLPALSFMRTDAQGEPDMESIRAALTQVLEREKGADLYITQGYICMNARDEVDNLKRGALWRRHRLSAIFTLMKRPSWPTSVPKSSTPPAFVPPVMPTFRCACSIPWSRRPPEP